MVNGILDYLWLVPALPLLGSCSTARSPCSRAAASSEEAGCRWPGVPGPMVTTPPTGRGTAIRMGASTKPRRTGTWSPHRPGGGRRGLRRGPSCACCRSPRAPRTGGPRADPLPLDQAGRSSSGGVAARPALLGDGPGRPPGVGVPHPRLLRGVHVHERAFAQDFVYSTCYVAMLTLVLANKLPADVRRVGGGGPLLVPSDRLLYEKQSASDAGKKAFVANRIGDFGVLLAMFLVSGPSVR